MSRCHFPESHDDGWDALRTTAEYAAHLMGAKTQTCMSNSHDAVKTHPRVATGCRGPRDFKHKTHGPQTTAQCSNAAATSKAGDMLRHSQCTQPRDSNGVITSKACDNDATTHTAPANATTTLDVGQQRRELGHPCDADGKFMSALALIQRRL